MTVVAETVWVVANRETARRWSRALREAGWPAYELPWGRPVPAPGADRAAGEVLAGADLVLLTSRHATAFLPPGALRGLPAACVGEGTAFAAEQAGCDVRLVGREGGLALAERILREAPTAQRVLWLRGVDVRPEAAALLRARGVEVTEVVTYGVEPCGDFAARLAAAPAPRAVAIGSPRAVDALVEAGAATLLEALRGVPFVALGLVTAGHVKIRIGARAHVAQTTDAAGLVQAVSALATGAGDPDE